MIFWTTLSNLPLGTLLVVEEDGTLIRVKYLDFEPSEDFVRSLLGKTDNEMYHQHTPFLNRTEAELREYFAGEREEFTIPYRYSGTSFQQRVWDSIASIPFGETLTYGDIAHHIDHPNASRAIGNACGRNPLPIIVPCHRVTGANGSLGGYSSGLEKKRFLLRLEEVS